MSTPTAAALDQAATAPPASRARIGAVDLLRGIVMVVMALDHVRDYFSSAHFEPTNLDKTTVPLFLTRWITHFCAPVFVFLAGTGAFLSRKPKPELARFLLSRGLWLILLELTWVRFGWTFQAFGPFFPLQVIWAIGWSMVALAALVFLPARVVGALGLTMIALHNLLDGVKSSAFGGAGWIWTILHEGGPLPQIAGRKPFVMYPLVPWIGVMAAGYAFGTLLTLERRKRDRAFIVIGGAAVALFVVLRASGIYGDHAQWEHRASTEMTAASFLNCTKYPPSLLYLCMTLGPAIMLLVPLESARGKIAEWLTVFGRVPLFYYLLHIPLIHFAALVVGAIKYGIHGPSTPNWESEAPADWGYGLAGVYLVWAIIVLLLFPACRWFAAVKRRRNDAWLSYL